MLSAPRDTEIPAEIVAVWQTIVDSVAGLLVVPSVMINRVDPVELHVFRSNSGPENPFPSGTRVPIAGVYCEAAARTKQKVEVSDARTDPLWADSPTARAGVFAYLGYPLLWPDGQVFGTICAVDTKENTWGYRYESILEAFKKAVEIHLALVATLDDLQARNQELARAMGEVKTLRGLLPICSSCKKIRNDTGYWDTVEDYISRNSEAAFTHSVCPDCTRRLYPELDLSE